eukprot:g16310.t1
MVYPEMSEEATSITGTWMLDLSRSDTFEGYLSFMGHSEAISRAQMDGERAYQSRNVIALDASGLIIYKDTAVNHFTERLELDQEQIKPLGSGRGVVHVTATLRDWARLDGYIITSIVVAHEGSRVLETREARQLVDGGRAHIQHITVQKVANMMPIAAMFDTLLTFVSIALLNGKTTATNDLLNTSKELMSIGCFVFVACVWLT